ncbi:hypothetical protein PMAYCL1PPCAC_27254, partial [Pristionchus mayeri]
KCHNQVTSPSLETWKLILRKTELYQLNFQYLKPEIPTILEEVLNVNTVHRMIVRKEIIDEDEFGPWLRYIKKMHSRSIDCYLQQFTKDSENVLVHLSDISRSIYIGVMSKPVIPNIMPLILGMFSRSCRQLYVVDYSPNPSAFISSFEIEKLVEVFTT